MKKFIAFIQDEFNDLQYIRDNKHPLLIVEAETTEEAKEIFENFIFNTSDVWLKGNPLHIIEYKENN